MIAQQVFRVSRAPAMTMVVTMAAVGGAGLASFRVPALLINPWVSIAAIVVGFGLAAIGLPAALLPNRVEIGSAGVTVVVSGRRTRFWWTEIRAMGEVTRKRRRALLVAVPKENRNGGRRGPVDFDDELGGWILANARRLRADPATLAAAVNGYAPGVWRSGR